MEGILAEECSKQAADEGCKVEVVWQDGDSSAAKAIAQHHPNGKVFRCGGHVGRAQRSCQKKEFSTDIKRKYEAQFPSVRTLKCKCERHKAGCGCLSDSFLPTACINHFCCLQQCNTPEEYARQLRALGEYHCRDMHEWGNGDTCGFHDNTVCSCKNCEEDEHIECEGQPYKTKVKLTCEYHRMAYRLECEHRSADAKMCYSPYHGKGTLKPL